MIDDTDVNGVLRTLLHSTDIGRAPHVDVPTVIAAGARRRRIRRATIGAGGAVVLTGLAVAVGLLIGRSQLQAIPPATSTTSVVPVTPHVPPPAPPDAFGEPAKGCAPVSDPVVTFTINPDGPMPSIACAIVGSSQQLRIVNATNAFGQPGSTITLQIGEEPERVLGMGRSTTYELPFGSYLTPGQHLLHVAPHDLTIVIWLK